MHANFRFAEYHAFLEIYLAITYGIFKTMDSNPVYELLGLRNKVLLI